MNMSKDACFHKNFNISVADLVNAANVQAQAVRAAEKAQMDMFCINPFNKFILEKCIDAAVVRGKVHTITQPRLTYYTKLADHKGHNTVLVSKLAESILPEAKPYGITTKKTLVSAIKYVIYACQYLHNTARYYYEDNYINVKGHDKQEVFLQMYNTAIIYKFVELFKDQKVIDRCIIHAKGISYTGIDTLWSFQAAYIPFRIDTDIDEIPLGVANIFTHRIPLLCSRLIKEIIVYAANNDHTWEWIGDKLSRPVELELVYADLNNERIRYGGSCLYWDFGDSTRLDNGSACVYAPYKLTVKKDYFLN